MSCSSLVCSSHVCPRLFVLHLYVCGFDAGDDDDDDDDDSSSLLSLSLSLSLFLLDELTHSYQKKHKRTILVGVCNSRTSISSIQVHRHNRRHLAWQVCSRVCVCVCWSESLYLSASLHPCIDSHHSPVWTFVRLVWHLLVLFVSIPFQATLSPFIHLLFYGKARL